MPLNPPLSNMSTEMLQHIPLLIFFSAVIFFLFSEIKKKEKDHKIALKEIKDSHKTTLKMTEEDHKATLKINDEERKSLQDKVDELKKYQNDLFNEMKNYLNILNRIPERHASASVLKSDLESLKDILRQDKASLDLKVVFKKSGNILLSIFEKHNERFKRTADLYKAEEKSENIHDEFDEELIALLNKLRENRSKLRCELPCL